MSNFVLLPTLFLVSLCLCCESIINTRLLFRSDDLRGGGDWDGGGGRGGGGGDRGERNIVSERTITLTFPERRSSRRFPFLSSLVSSLVSPERRNLPPDGPSNGLQTIDEEPRLRGSAIELVHADVINEEDNLTDRPIRTRGFFLINILSRMLRSVNFTAITEEMRSGRTSSRASCLACNAVAALYLSPLYSKEVMVAAARSVCISFRLQSPRVCRGLVESFKNDLDFIRRNTKLNRHEMCGVVFGMDCARTVTPHLNWTIAVPPNKRASRRFKRQDVQFPANNLPFISAVQISDIHIDPYYMPGMNADCGEPLCCRVTDGYAPSPEKAAGVWGDYRNCDTPLGTLRNALRHIRQNHPDATYYMLTGDYVPHDIWNITREEVIFQIRLVTDLIKENTDVPVFPVIGNHEGVPVNSFPPPEVKGETSISWLYEEVARQWSYWLPEDALETLRYGGYYKVKVRPGFRVVCINTNYCTRLNPWTLFDPVDPGNQLEWLTEELFKAEVDGDKVHIIGHIPPDNRECTQAWLFNYLRIIDRFQKTVLAQYYGHTHRDEFRILFSPYNRPKPKPISIEYIGPSITSFTENNPAYRVYYMDGEGYVKDHATYFVNLTEANLGSAPVWRKEYSAYDTFNMTNLGPSEWHRLVNRLADNDILFQRFYRLYFRYSEVKRRESCFGECRKNILDDLLVAHPLKTKPRSLFGSRKH